MNDLGIEFYYGLVHVFFSVMTTLDFPVFMFSYLFIAKKQLIICLYDVRSPHVIPS